MVHMELNQSQNLVFIYNDLEEKTQNGKVYQMFLKNLG